MPDALEAYPELDQIIGRLRDRNPDLRFEDVVRIDAAEALLVQATFDAIFLNLGLLGPYPHRAVLEAACVVGIWLGQLGLARVGGGTSAAHLPELGRPAYRATSRSADDELVAGAGGDSAPSLPTSLRTPRALKAGPSETLCY